MNKETEEIIMLVVGGFILLSVLNKGSVSATQAAQLNAATTVGLANAASSTVVGLANAFTGN